MSSVRNIASVALVLLSLAMVAGAQQEGEPEQNVNNAICNGRNPGSVLIFPALRSGEGFITIVSVTNVCTDPINGETALHYEYMNVDPDESGLDPFCITDWSVFNRTECVTPADTITVVTRCHNPEPSIALPGPSPATVAEDRQGYLVVTAQDCDQFDFNWSFNCLIGSEYVINGTGTTYGLPAYSFCAHTPMFTNTDVNGNGRIDFDGIEYDKIADKLYIDSFLAPIGQYLTLINLTGGPFDRNTVQMNVFNDNEVPLSATFQFCGWMQARLDEISPLFTEAFLLGVPNDAAEFDYTCDGVEDAQTGWVVIESSAVRTPGGDLIANDGALLGAIVAGPSTVALNGGRLLWESVAAQSNGTFFQP